MVNSQKICVLKYNIDLDTMKVGLQNLPHIVSFIMWVIFPIEKLKLFICIFYHFRMRRLSLNNDSER